MVCKNKTKNADKSTFAWLAEVHRQGPIQQIEMRHSAVTCICKIKLTRKSSVRICVENSKQGNHKKWENLSSFRERSPSNYIVTVTLTWKTCLVKCCDRPLNLQLIALLLLLGWDHCMLHVILCGATLGWYFQTRIGDRNGQWYTIMDSHGQMDLRVTNFTLYCFQHQYLQHAISLTKIDHTCRIAPVPHGGKDSGWNFNFTKTKINLEI